MYIGGSGFFLEKKSTMIGGKRTRAGSIWMAGIKVQFI